MRIHRPRRFALGILLVLLVFIFRSPFSVSSRIWTTQPTEFGSSFDVTNVEWSQGQNDGRVVLNWKVEFENTSGFEFTGARGVGIEIQLIDADGQVTRSGESFIDKAVPGENTISGSIPTAVISDDVRLLFIE